MAQIVCIDTGTLNTKVNAIDDVVAVHEDDVDLTGGTGYDGYKIVKVEGKTGTEVSQIFNAKHPEQNRAVKVTSDKWCFMEEKEVWKNDKGKWCDLISRPKYAITLKDITTADRVKLADKIVAVSEKDTLLNKAFEKIHLDSKNNVEVADLNLAE